MTGHVICVLNNSVLVIIIPLRRATIARILGLTSSMRSSVVLRSSTDVISLECKRRESSIAEMLNNSAGNVFIINY